MVWWINKRFRLFKNENNSDISIYQIYLPKFTRKYREIREMKFIQINYNGLQLQYQDDFRISCELSRRFSCLNKYVRPLSLPSLHLRYCTEFFSSFLQLRPTQNYFPIRGVWPYLSHGQPNKRILNRAFFLRRVQVIGCCLNTPGIPNKCLGSHWHSPKRGASGATR